MRPEVPRCESCPVAEGECYARRSRTPRLCRLPAMRARLAEWGTDGGPEVAAVRGHPIPTLPPPPPPPAGLADPISEWAYVTEEMLLADLRTLYHALPGDIDAVIGVARSGFLVAGHLAAWLHVPLLSVSRDAGVLDIGHGFRMRGDRAAPRKILVVDDTVATGQEMAASLPLVRAAYPDATIATAVVYAIPAVARSVDLFVRSYPGPHYLAWNWYNAGHGSACGYDFDGILCRDDDPQNRPLYLPRRTPIPLIVTGRHESARGITQAWLDEWGVRCDRLVMRDFGDPRDYTGVGEWKGAVYRDSACVLFAESDPGQAQAIARVSGKAVLCPKLGRVIPPRPFETATDIRRREVEEAKAWYAALPPGVKAAAEGCVHKRATTRKSCCGTVEATRCVGGTRDGEYVDVLACARCQAKIMGV